MTSQLNESSGSDFCTQSDARPNQMSLSSQHEEEGCPVIEESGTVCGETRTLNIFQDFRAIYDNCMRKMEGNKDDKLALKKLAPFKKLVEDLWEQNAVLVETVEELEQEAANRVTVLQNKLDECSEKVNEYLQDIDSLVEVIRRFRENGKLDSKGLKFNSICDFEIHGPDKSSCDLLQESNAKERYHNIPVVQQDSCKSIMRDISTNTNDFGSSKSFKNKSRPVSYQRDASTSSICSELFANSMSKVPQSSFEKPGKCYLCFATKPNCECEGSSHSYTTPDEELSSERLWKDNCMSIGANKSNMVKSQFKVKDEEGDEVIENFYSAEDCTKEIERRERSDKKTVVGIRKLDNRILKSLKDEQTNKKGRFDWSNEGNKCRGCALERTISNSTSLNLINEHSASDCENCDCNCDVCGCSSCGR